MNIKSEVLYVGGKVFEGSNKYVITDIVWPDKVDAMKDGCVRMGQVFVNLNNGTKYRIAIVETYEMDGARLVVVYVASMWAGYQGIFKTIPEGLNLTEPEYFEVSHDGELITPVEITSVEDFFDKKQFRFYHP